MIVADFYPTKSDMDFSVQNGSKFTYNVVDIPITTQDFTQAYWIGWMGWDKLPQSYHVSSSDFSNGVLTFTDNTKPENVPVGFFSSYGTQTYIYRWAAAFLKYNSTAQKWKNIDWAYKSQASDYVYLPNGLDINTCSWGRLRLIFFALSEDKATQLEKFIADVSFPDFVAKNDFTAYIESGFYTGNVTISMSDIENYATFQKTINNRVFNCVLISYTVPYNRDITYNSALYNYMAVHPMVQIHNNDDLAYIASITNPVQFQFEDNAYWSGDLQGQGFISNWNGAINGLTAFNNNGVYDWCGGFVGSVNVNDVPPNVYNIHIPENANFYCRSVGRSDFFIIGRILTYNEILGCLSLLPRMFNGSQTYTQDVNYWYGKIDLETGEFLGELINGSDTTKLAEWQIIGNNLTISEFTKDDIPEYVPPTPSDAENIGDKITRPATLGIGGTNGFVTLYAMRKSDIAQLGELLWTSFIDADYWKNYLFSLALDTGTFSLAGLLNFFVSCRVYPFSLINVAGCTSFGRNMYVGTGTVPLEFTAQTTLHVLTDMVDYISGGYCNVPRYFNDWRDYVNTEIILYIPYCGTVRLNPGDVIGNKISVQYAVDFATGGCIAYVDMETGDGAGYPVGALPGQIGADIPLTATAAGEVAARFIGDALNIGGIVAGEGASVASGALGAAMGKPSAGGSGNILSGAAGMMGGLPAAMAVDMAVPLAKQGLSMLARGAVQAPMLSGGRGFASFGAPQVPYVQIRRGIYPEISGLLDIAGKPAATTTTIGALSGFVQGDVKTDGLPCHENEKAKIRRLIADGIYV